MRPAQLTAVWMWTPSRLASTAGGRSDAQAASAVLRACRGSIPCWRSLPVLVWGATGRAGERPGKSGRGPGWPGAASSWARTRVASRGRRRTGTVSSRRHVSGPCCSMSASEVCDERFGRRPVQVFHEWNSVAYVSDHDIGDKQLRYGELLRHGSFPWQFDTERLRDPQPTGAGRLLPAGTRALEPEHFAGARGDRADREGTCRTHSRQTDS